MDRRIFLGQLSAMLVVPPRPTKAQQLVQAARTQIGLTTGYDPAYRHIAYPNGDVPRTTGICADVVVRACRDALALDLQSLVHEDMLRNFPAYPRTWGLKHPDSNIDHRRVLNLQTFWTRQGTRQWMAHGSNSPGDSFGETARPGDFVTWLIGGSLPHVGVIASTGGSGGTVVHNIGEGAQETPLVAFASHPAVGRYRWPAR